MDNVIEQPLLHSDVIVEKTQSVDAEVSVLSDEEYGIGTPLTTTDGGKTFSKAVDGDDVVVNGILCEILDASGVANVMVTGKAVAKHIDGLTDRMQVSAFKNKIILI